MGILKKLKEFWASTDPRNSPDPGEGEWQPQVTAAELTSKKAALGAFVTGAFAFLGDEAAKKLARRVTVKFNPNPEAEEMVDMAGALRDGLEGNPFTKGGRVAYAMTCDARYVEGEVAWVAALGKAYGLAGGFTAAPVQAGAPRSATPTDFFFTELKQWLGPQDFAMVFVDTDGDEYCFFLAPEDQVAAVVQSGLALGLALSTALPNDCQPG